jgi:hypothetical protein
VDPDVPSPARVWNVWLGGTDNFPVDRELARRTRAKVTRFFDGLDVMPPGVVPVSEWDLGEAMDTTIGGLVGYVGISRKP